MLSAGSYQSRSDRPKGAEPHGIPAPNLTAIPRQTGRGKGKELKGVWERIGERRGVGGSLNGHRPPSQAVSVPVHSRGSRYVVEFETECGRRCRKHEILERTCVIGSQDRPPGKVRRWSACRGVAVHVFRFVWCFPSSFRESRCLLRGRESRWKGFPTSEQRCCCLWLCLCLACSVWTFKEAYWHGKQGFASTKR